MHCSPWSPECPYKVAPLSGLQIEFDFRRMHLREPDAVGPAGGRPRKLDFSTGGNGDNRGRESALRSLCFLLFKGFIRFGPNAALDKASSAGGPISTMASGLYCRGPSRQLFS